MTLRQAGRRAWNACRAAPVISKTHSRRQPTTISQCPQGSVGHAGQPHTRTESTGKDPRTPNLVGAGHDAAAL